MAQFCLSRDIHTISYTPHGRRDLGHLISRDVNEKKNPCNKPTLYRADFGYIKCVLEWVFGSVFQTCAGMGRVMGFIRQHNISVTRFY